MDASEGTDALHRDLRNILRTKMRRRRELFGEKYLRELANRELSQNDEFVCYESKDEFVRRYPSIDDQQDYVDLARSLQLLSKRDSANMRHRIELALGLDANEDAPFR